MIRIAIAGLLLGLAAAASAPVGIGPRVLVDSAPWREAADRHDEAEALDEWGAGAQAHRDAAAHVVAAAKLRELQRRSAPTVGSFEDTGSVADAAPGLAFLPLVLGHAPAPSGPPLLRLVDQLGGANHAIAVAGANAYLAAGPRVVILDVSDPGEPVLVGRSDVFSGQVLGVDVDELGGLVYVVHGGPQTGLSVLDVSEPAGPVVIGQHYWPSDLPGVRSTLRARRLEIADGYAYIVAAGQGGVRIVDVRDPAAPVEVGRVDWPYEMQTPAGRHTMFGSAADLSVAGNHAFVVGARSPEYRDSGWLRVLDVSDPADPTLVGSLVWPDVRPSRIAVWSGHAYLAVGGYGLRVIDVSDPSSPRRLSDVHVPIDAEWSDKALDVAVDGGIAYALLDGTWPYRSGGQLAVFDLTDPSTPILLRHVEDLAGAQRLATAGAHVYVVGGETGLQVVDVSSPTSPQLVGRYHAMGSVHDVEAGSDFVFVGAAQDGLRVIDVSSPGPAREIGALDVALHSVSQLWGGRRLFVRDQMAYAIGENERRYPALMLIDLSDPSTPVLSGSVADESGGPVRGIHVTRGHAYAGAEGLDDDLLIYDVRDPRAPSLVGGVPFVREGVNAVHAVDGHAYIGGCGLLGILDLQDAIRPTWVGEMESDGELIDVFAQDGMAYTIESGGEGEDSVLRIVDVSDSERPVMLGSSVGGSSTELVGAGTVVVDDYAYWADGDLRVIDVSDPWNPRPVAVLPTPGFAADVAVTTRLVLVADLEGGLIVFERTLSEGRQ